jgi:chorismate mutase
MSLSELREEIDGLNRQLVVLLGRRLKIAKEIARIKKKDGLPIFDPVREEKIKAEIRELARAEGLSVPVVEEIFTLLLEYTRLEQEAQS